MAPSNASASPAKQERGQPCPRVALRGV